MAVEAISSDESAPVTFHGGGIHHLAIRVTDLARAREFYSTTLGFPEVLRTDELVLLNVHGTFLGLRGDAPDTDPNDRFSPFRVGLDHLALAVPGTDALLELQRQLDVAGIPNNGIENDSLLGAAYVSFYDPDGIAWELYSLPAQSS
jgi:glyoxylase I family protein